MATPADGASETLAFIPTCATGDRPSAFTRTTNSEELHPQLPKPRVRCYRNLAERSAQLADKMRNGCAHTQVLVTNQWRDQKSSPNETEARSLTRLARTLGSTGPGQREVAQNPNILKNGAGKQCDSNSRNPRRWKTSRPECSLVPGSPRVQACDDVLPESPRVRACDDVPCANKT